MTHAQGVDGMKREKRKPPNTSSIPGKSKSYDHI